MKKLILLLAALMAPGVAFSYTFMSQPSGIQNTNTLQSGATFYVSSGTVASNLYAGELTIASQGGVTITGSGGTGRFVMEGGFGGLDLTGLQYFTISNDSGHFSLGSGIDSGIRRLGAASIGVTNGQNGSGSLTTLDLNATRHINGEGTTPTLDACGTSPSIVGSDLAALVTVGTSTGTCGVIFNAAWTNPPICTVSPRAQSLTNALSYNVTISSISLAQTSMGGSKLDVHCMGRD